MNKTSNDKNDAFHRKQLRQRFVIQNTKIMENGELHSITKQKTLSTHISENSYVQLGHILRENNPIGDILHHIALLKPGKGVTKPPANPLSRLTGTILAPVYSKTGL